MNDLIETVRSDAEASVNRWDGAVESAERDGDMAQAKTWKEQGERCAEHYEAAVEALEAGDLDTAETELERASALESEAGDNCDAHHALKAVRAAGSGLDDEHCPDEDREAASRAPRF